MMVAPETQKIVSVNITVNSVNDAPVAVDDPAYITDEDTPLTVDAATGVLANDTDVDHAVPLTTLPVDATGAPGARARR